MKNKKQIQRQLEYFESFGDNGRYPFNTFEEAMGASVLKKALEYYKSKKELKEFIESEFKKLSKSFQTHKQNLRGMAISFEIKHYLWILDSKLEDYFDENDRLIIENEIQN